MHGGSFTNYRREEKKELPIGALVNAFGRRQAAVADFFEPDGHLNQVFPDYTKRQSQVDLAQMVWRALDQRLTLIAEADTGTGKSFANLIPAILWAVQRRCTVVVSTATIALQAQYCNIDLPLLERAFAAAGLAFSWAEGKGRSNYYCLESQGADGEFAAENEFLAEWLLETQTGDFGELPFEIKQPRLTKFWEANRADSEDCPGRSKCAVGQQCWFYKARERAEDAHVIVVNHALLALNDRLEGVILPAYHALIVDEAHQLEQYVRSAWEETLSAKRCYRIGAKLAKAGLDGQDELDQIGKLLGELLAQYVAQFGNNTPSTLEIVRSKWPAGWDEFSGHASRQLADLENTLISLAEEIGKAVPLASACAELRRSLRLVTAEDEAARWIEHNKQGVPSLKIVPVDVSRQMQRLYHVPTVLTSATLATGGSYEFAKSEMGVASALEMPPLHSPFDWRENALYVFPRAGTLKESDMKPLRGESTRQTARRWATRIAGPIKSLLERTSGRAFCLFTSKAVMEECYHLVAPHCREEGWTVLMQGEFSKRETVVRFKAGTSPVLFATASFWEGVDIPGAQLSAVIIDKIPWPSPSDPIEKAKSDRFGFAGYNIPMVVRKLRQGVGRLIRRATDKGIVCILDPRVYKYANQILRHLPGDAVGALHRSGPANITAFLDAAGAREAASEVEAWAAAALSHLAAHDPDRAREENDVGFSAADTHRGNELAAALPRLSDRQWAIATALCRRYWRQVGHPPTPTINFEGEDAA